MVLQHAMRHDHVRAKQFFAVTQSLYEIFPIVDAHLQIKFSNVSAGITLTGSVELHLLEGIREDNIKIFQDFEKTLRVHKASFGCIHKNRIAAKTRYF